LGWADGHLGRRRRTARRGPSGTAEGAGDPIARAHHRPARADRSATVPGLPARHHGVAAEVAVGRGGGVARRFRLVGISRLSRYISPLWACRRLLDAQAARRTGGAGRAQRLARRIAESAPPRASPLRPGRPAWRAGLVHGPARRRRVPERVCRKYRASERPERAADRGPVHDHRVLTSWVGHRRVLSAESKPTNLS